MSAISLGAGGGQDLAAVPGDQDGVFDPDADILLGKIERRLDGEDHALLEPGDARADVVRAHADEMPEAALFAVSVEPLLLEDVATCSGRRPLWRRAYRPPMQAVWMASTTS